MLDKDVPIKAMFTCLLDMEKNVATIDTEKELLSISHAKLAFPR